ncbi:MAG TPA: ATP-binding protein [Bacteroidales bacterium]|nr:ATP-binding protein [Bacteroidales bacterium]
MAITNTPDKNDLSKEEADLKRAELERKLNHSYYLLQYVIEHDHSIAVLDKDLKHIYVSRRFLSDNQVTEDDVIGKYHYDVFPNLPESWKKAHQRALAGEVVRSFEEQFTDKEGKKQWGTWECRPWKEADGSIGGIIIYTETVTKYKEVEMELTAAKEKAEESNRLKTAFLQNISHEVRTPLNSIVGFSELLADPSQPMHKKSSFSKIIAVNSQKLIRIISDVIEISQIQSKQLSVIISGFDVVSLLYKVADSFMEITQLKDLEFRVNQHIDEENSIILSDKGKLEKIFFHLIDNAIKFTKKGSVFIDLDLKDDILSFIISDTGIGVEPEKKDLIFDPFLQIETGLNRSQGGTGLGLTIVKSFTEFLNGTITIDSELNAGTTVTVKIPVKSDVKPGKIPAATKTRIDELATRIVIAEDEYSNFKYLYEVLKNDKLEIFHANNGREAVDLCKNDPEIKLVLMDLKMPVMDGTTAARHIREFRPEILIIAQTAYFPEDQKMNNVFDDFISKPISRKDLINLISRYINVPDLTPGSQR